jgi:iron complex outermembrane receptor protein
MNYRFLTPIILSSSVMISTACAQEIVSLDKIQIAEEYTAIDARRDNSIAKRIISGAELTQYGDTNALEVLRRTPGVTIPAGRGNRGAPGKGYTIVMIDGEETSTDTSHRASPLEQISPDMIEKIEVMTNGSAEHTSESMGGIVNIILKKPKAEGLTTAKLTLGTYGDSLNDTLFAQREGKVDKVSYLVNLTASEQRKDDDYDVLRKSALSSSKEEREDKMFNRSLSLRSKIIYTPSTKNKYIYDGSITFNDDAEDIDAQTYLNGSSAVSSEIQNKDRSERTMLWSAISGEHHLSGDQLLEWKLKIHQLEEDGKTISETAPIVNIKKDDDYVFSRFYGAEGSYSLIADEHFVKAGMEIKRSDQQDEVTRTLNGVDITAADDNVRMREDKISIYLQDEINFGETMVLTPGLRYETLSRDYGATSQTDYFTASLHFLNHLSPKDNLRASVAQTVRLPRLSQLSTSTNTTLDYNDIHRPDVTGNPDLTEEKALSYELRFEHFFEDKGIASISGFYRDISNKIENIVQYDTLTSRYVERPENAGEGALWGVEAEFKKSLNSYVDGLGIFANATVQNSSLTNTINGSKYPIKQTSNLLYNLGFDHTLKAYKLTYGAAYRYVGGYDDPEEYLISQSQKGYGTLDLYASKRIDKIFKLQLNLKNITSTTIETKSHLYDTAGNITETQIDKEYSKPQILLTLEGKW